MYYDIQNTFPCHIEPTDRTGRVLLSFEMDTAELRPFITMLESLQNFFRFLNNKSKTALVTQRMPENKQKYVKYFDEYCTAVNDCFKQLRHVHPEQTAREHLSATARIVKDNYPNASYDSVKQILTKSGLLKLHGFYK